jgi:hypothetical protein
MEDAFELKGRWWLPESPENEVPGELIYSPDDDVRLELQGDLHAPDDGGFHPPIFRNAGLILGITLKGKEVSLLDCTQLKGNVTLGESRVIPQTAFRCKYAFIGYHFESSVTVKFKEILVRFTQLDDWFDQNPFHYEQSNSFSEVNLGYNAPESCQATVGEYTILFFSVGPSLSRPSAGEFSISQKAWIKITSINCERNFQDFLPVIRRIQDFLTLGVGIPVFPIEMEGFCESNTQILENGKVYPYSIQIFYALPWQAKPMRRIYPTEMVFTLKYLQDRLEIFLQNWFAKSDDLKPVLDIYFSLLYRDDIYAEFRFLGLAQAIETYHRRMYGGKYQPDDEYIAGLYKRFLQVIPSDINRSFRKSLTEGKLRFANEYSLRKRLQELIRSLQNILLFPFIADTTERNKFIDQVCNTRNYLTHYDIELQSKAATTGEEIYQLQIELRAILDALFLRDIGFAVDGINELLNKNRNYYKLFNSNQ